MTIPRFEHEWIDTSRSPLVIWTLPATVDDLALKRLCETWSRFLRDLSEPYAMLIDATKLQRASAYQRNMLGNMLKERELESGTWCVGGAVLLDSELVRGFVTAVTWVVKPNFPLEVFRDRHDALDWLHKALDECRESAVK